jgi:hypothetical protein
MAHANNDALDGIDALLLKLRALPGIEERKRGVFYKRRAAFLHFHGGAGELAADLKSAKTVQWIRMPLRHTRDQQRLLKSAIAELGSA